MPATAAAATAAAGDDDLPGRHGGECRHGLPGTASSAATAATAARTGRRARLTHKWRNGGGTSPPLRQLRVSQESRSRDAALVVIAFQPRCRLAIEASRPGHPTWLAGGSGGERHRSVVSR
jgi:hypothetical protein